LPMSPDARGARKNSGNRVTTSNRTIIGIY
jgi:hypothetical protein